MDQRAVEYGKQADEINSRIDLPWADARDSNDGEDGSKNRNLAEQLIKIFDAKCPSSMADISCRAQVLDMLTAWLSLPAEVKVQMKSLLNNLYNPANDSFSLSPFKPLNGYTSKAEPVPRAPENVFVFRNSLTGRPFGWRNLFQHSIEYDVELCPEGVLSPKNSALANRLMPEGSHRRRFLVVDDAVNKIYGQKIENYFKHHKVEFRQIVLKGEECNKRMEAVDSILEELCSFKLLRREPIIAIGGGVILDIVGLAANLYRRGVPYMRVPTTLLAIVDASVGVKNGVDYCSCSCGPQKNRVGSFYAPSAAFLDKTFIATQDKRNLVNGLGEIMKLALVRSAELFCLLESFGPKLIKEKFQGKEPYADRVIELSVQIMLEELGPNLWEQNLERCVDYGHTFSKIFEMVPGADLMHGEAVNIDGFFCVLLSKRRKMISAVLCNRIFEAMNRLGLPTFHSSVTVENLEQGLNDAVQHRNGAQRIPLINGIGSSVCVNDISREEIDAVCYEIHAMHSQRR